MRWWDIVVIQEIRETVDGQHGQSVGQRKLAMTMKRMLLNLHVIIIPYYYHHY